MIRNTLILTALIGFAVASGAVYASPLNAKQIDPEWNYWYGPHQFGELGTRYFLKDALGIAAGVNEYARQSDIVASAFYAQTVNVIGAIKVSRRNAAFATTGLVLKLYRQHFGELPVTTQFTGPIDAQAAWSKDRKTLTISIINATTEKAEIPVSLRGARLKGGGTKWQIAGADPMAYNDPDQPAKVKIEQDTVGRLGDKLSVAPCSVTLLSDVIILDIKMPGMSGIDLLKELKARSIKAKIIIVSAFVDSNIQQLASDYGVVAVLRIPVDGEALIDLIKYNKRIESV